MVEIEKRKFDFSNIRIELDEELQKVEEKIASIEGSVISLSDLGFDSQEGEDVFGGGNQVADLVKDMMSSDGEDEEETRKKAADKIKGLGANLEDH